MESFTITNTYPADVAVKCTVTWQFENPQHPNQGPCAYQGPYVIPGFYEEFEVQLAPPTRRQNFITSFT